MNSILQPDHETGLIFDQSGTFERLEGDKELIIEAIFIFFRDFPETLKDIKASIEKNNMNVLHRYVHTLKGNAATVGAVKVYNAAFNMEQTVIKEESDKFDYYLNLIEKEFQIYKYHIKQTELFND